MRMLTEDEFVALIRIDCFKKVFLRLLDDCGSTAVLKSPKVCRWCHNNENTGVLRRKCLLTTKDIEER